MRKIKKKKIILITADEIRHRFFKNKVSQFDSFKLSLCIYEDNNKRQSQLISKDKFAPYKIKKHFQNRKTYEKKFLRYIKNQKFKEIKIKKEEINNNEKLEKLIMNINPDFIISYGCSIIKSELINKFKRKFINLHLGLAPYYKGNGTNFWPIANNEFQFLGGTFMLIDNGIDSGPILHQFRPDLEIKDNTHSIGCKIIFQSVKELEKLLMMFNKVKSYRQKRIKISRIYKRKDFKLSALIKAYSNLKKIRYYLNYKKKIDKKYPIISI